MYFLFLPCPATREHDISQSRHFLKGTDNHSELTTTPFVGSLVFEMMWDEESGEDEIRIEEKIFLHHIDQLKREKNRDIGTIAEVLLEAHVFIREKFHKLQARNSFDRNISF